MIRMLLTLGVCAVLATIGMAVEMIESTSSLTEAQGRDILYNNAARFLRLSSNGGRASMRQPDL